MDTQTQPPPVVKALLPAAGLHPGVPFATYAQWPAANHSLLKNFDRSALHARHAIDNPRPMTDALRMGHALHVATFEPARFIEEFIVIPDFNWTKEKAEALAHLSNLCGQDFDPKTKKADAIAAVEATGVCIIDAGQHADLMGMGDAIRNSAAASRFVSMGGQCEVSCLWRDSATGMDCKGRFDKLAVLKGGNLIVELKSTDDARKSAFERSIAKFFYAEQAANYLRGLEAVTGARPTHLIIAVEKSAPYGVATYMLPDVWVQIGDVRSRKWLAKYAECLETDEWPGYPDKVQLLDMPVWAQRMEEE